MKTKIVKFAILSVAAALMVGCGGGGDSDNETQNDTTPAITYSNYSIKVVDDAVIGAKISAIGCEGYNEKGGGEYELLNCTQKPTIIVASGGTIDMNGDGKIDSNDVPMALPFTLDVTQSNSEDGFVVSPLTTLAAEAKESELETLAERLGISKSELFEDLSKDENKKEILQLINAQFIAASENGVIDMPAFLGKFKEYLLNSGSTDAKESITSVVEALKNDTDAPKIFGGIGFNGFISEAESLKDTDLAKYYENKSSDPTKTVFLGYVYDEILADANVSIYIDNTLISSSRSDGNGKFTLEVDSDKIGENKIIKIEAVLNDYKGDNVKLVTFLTSTQIKELAKNRVSISDLIDIVVSNVTTAEYIVAKKLNGGNDFTDAGTLEENLLKAQIEKAEKVKETAALIKYIVDTNATQTSADDTLAYVESKLDTNLTLDINETEQQNIETFKTEIENDPILSKQLEVTGESVATGTTLKTLYDNGVKEFYIVYADKQYDGTGNEYYQRRYAKITFNIDSMEFAEYYLENNSWVLDGVEKISGSFDNTGTFYFTDPKTGFEKVWLISSSSVANGYLNRDFNIYLMSHALYKSYDDEFYLSMFDGYYDSSIALDQNVENWSSFISTYGSSNFNDIGVLNSDGTIASDYWSKWEHFTVDGKDFIRVYTDFNRDSRIYAIDYVNKKAYKKYELREEYIDTPLYFLSSNNYELVEAFRFADDADFSLFENFDQNDDDIAYAYGVQSFLERLLEEYDVQNPTSSTTTQTTTAEQEEWVKSLLGGKTLYIIDEGDCVIKKMVINEDVTLLQFINEDNGSVREYESQVVGNAVVDIDGYHYIDGETGTYIYGHEIDGEFKLYLTKEYAEAAFAEKFPDGQCSTSSTSGSPTSNLDDTILSNMWQSNALISPNGGESWFNGENREVTWNASEIVGDTVNCYVLHDDPSNILSAMSNNDAVSLTNAITSANWYKFATDVQNSGVIGIDPSVMSGGGDAYLVLIVSDNGYWDISDGVFSLNYQNDINFTDYLVGKTYYIAVTDVTNKHVETIYFRTDGILQVTWDENGQTMEELFSYTIDGNILHLTNTNDPNDTYTMELSLLDGKLFAKDLDNGYVDTLYETYAEAEAAL